MPYPPGSWEFRLGIDFGTSGARAIVIDVEANIQAEARYSFQDMQLAADLMKVVHNQNHAGDGFVNLDLPPQSALAPQTTLIEARRLWQTVGWSNLMLKIPATTATMPVSEQLIHEGINLNVTMLFSQTVYEQVVEAYLSCTDRHAPGNRTGTRITRLS